MTQNENGKALKVSNISIIFFGTKPIEHDTLAGLPLTFDSNLVKYGKVFF